MIKLIFYFFLVGTFQRIFAQEQIFQRWSKQEETEEFWYTNGRMALEEVLQRNYDQKPAKNVILFLGNGLGISTITAGRISKGQKEGKPGEETITSLDKFESVGLSKVYSVDQQSPDGSSTATAILSGVKTKKDLVGVNGKVQIGNCLSMEGNEIESVFDAAARQGKSTGLVTTLNVQNGNIAPAYAHSPSRTWVADQDMPQQAIQEGCKDISLQLFEMRNKINVILGGGRVNLKPIGTSDEEYSSKFARGRRSDGRNLVEEWKNSVPNSKYVWNQTEFDNVDPLETDYLLGLFQPFGMRFEHSRINDEGGEPSISEMTKKAIQILQKNSEGYFLYVNGGKIDNGHHSNKAQVALNEFLAFENAIETAMNMVSLNDTLVIVAGNHGHGFTLGAYADRGNPINGFARNNLIPEQAADGHLYTAITYANGPGHQGANKQRLRVGPTFKELSNINYKFQSAVPLSSAAHSAEDTVVLASGPMSQLFSGTFEQNYISHAMKYASCIGADQSLCNEEVNNEIGSSDTNMNCSEVNEESTNTKVTEFLEEVDEKLIGLLDSMEILTSLRSSLVNLNGNETYLPQENSQTNKNENTQSNNESESELDLTEARELKLKSKKYFNV